MTIIVAFSCLSFLSPVDLSSLIVPPDMPPSAQYGSVPTRVARICSGRPRRHAEHAHFGVIVAVLSRIISITVGLTAGYVGGWVDRALMFFNDIFVAVPIFPILVMFYFVLRNDLDRDTGDHHGLLRLALRRPTDPLRRAELAAPRVHPPSGVRRA